jgi:hypothetical protein
MATVPAPLDPNAHETLCAASLIISSFRWKLRENGFPFKEPPGVDAIIRDIDALCFPDVPKSKQKTQSA